MRVRALLAARLLGSQLPGGQLPQLPSCLGAGCCAFMQAIAHGRGIRQPWPALVCSPPPPFSSPCLPFPLCLPRSSVS